jgi:hypothetical protein
VVKNLASSCDSPIDMHTLDPCRLSWTVRTFLRPTDSTDAQDHGGKNFNVKQLDRMTSGSQENAAVFELPERLAE